MRLQGIKIRLTIITCSLLLVAMLLVNFVLIILWQHDALQREISRDKAVISRIQDHLPNKTADLLNLRSDSLFFSDLYPAGETGRILLVTNPAGTPAQGLEVIKNTFPNLDQTIAEAMTTGRATYHYSNFLPGLFNFRSHVLIIAEPIKRRNKIVGGIGILRSLEPMLQTLWRAEKIVLAYIFINLVIFMVISFYRTRNLVARPIERLVKLADRYEDQEALLFSVDSKSGEFSQLAFSLNSMLTRIENDRKALAENVAELEAVNRKLKDQQQEMIRTEKLASIGRMASGLAHEIGNPIGVVQGYLGLLSKTDTQGDQYQEFIKRAEQELLRVNILIRQMLDFARISKGEPQNCSLHELLLSIIDMVRMQPAFKDISVECNLEAEQDIVCADQDQLRQVFVNCLLNSADAVMASERKNSGLISVTTQVVKGRDNNPEKNIRIRIRDNGTGIAPEHLTSIFDPFYTTKEPGKGTGLGLSVSLSIIESLDGRIQIESKEETGSVLSVFLPLRKRGQSPF